ncbi:MAG: cytochrome c3 family protein [Phycisphaerales bacterium JB039]
MRRRDVVTVSAALVIFATAPVSGQPMHGGGSPNQASRPAGTISNTGHDFSGLAWADGEICKPCHTPHNAVAIVPPLWNHEQTTAVYTMHAGTGSAADDFDLSTRLCLSCHDGTVAVDSFGGQPGSTFISARANLGTDLSDDHPVGTDALYPPDPKPSWWDSAFLATPTVRLYAWIDPATGARYPSVGCRSCHDPHGRGGYAYMLVKPNTASRLCLSCHIK